MINDRFEGSNTKDFKNSKVLFKITDKPTRMEEKNTVTDEKFRYVRYISTSSEQTLQRPSLSYLWDDLNIAELAFCDEQGNRLSGKVLASSQSSLKNSRNAFDNDIRTNTTSNKLCWLGLDLGEPTKIYKVKYLFQNSFNSIEAGDEYELFYWDQEWKSLGKKVAMKDYVKYSVPKNTLLWLRNLTKGKEEQVFFFKNGKQIWG